MLGESARAPIPCQTMSQDPTESDMGGSISRGIMEGLPRIPGCATLPSEMTPMPLSRSCAAAHSRLGKLTLLGLLSFTTFAGPCGATSDIGPEVQVTGGAIRGRTLPDDQGSVFRGIPFARPPLAGFRWREPMPVVPWSGVREADHPGPPAEQPPLGWNDKFAAACSEDCLYLDLWAPKTRISGSIPVMVWIHGGGNVAGAGGFDPLYDGRALISHGVILVVVEYRLGMFGFFSHPELTRESPHHASGNYGVLDQIAALQWVHDNVSRFGGDPGNVTIFGQSAGGLDVLGLMASPLSEGLFQRAISESGPLGAVSTQPLTDAQKAGAQAVEGLGGPRSNDLEYLRSLPPEALVKLGQGLRPFIRDGWVFPKSPFEVWQGHLEHAVPLIIGANALEFPASGSPAEIRAMLGDFFGNLAPRAFSLYGLEGTGNPIQPDPLYGNGADQWGSDLFRCIGIVEGGWHSTANSCWEYEFDRAIPPHPRVAHSSDLPYVFGNLSETGSMPGNYVQADRRLSAMIQGYWTNFAKTGNPNAAGLPEWQKYDTTQKRYLDFTTEADAMVRENERGSFADLFRDAMERRSDAP
jgi:para-nitrobenzyl esterase